MSGARPWRYKDKWLFLISMIKNTHTRSYSTQPIYPVVWDKILCYPWFISYPTANSSIVMEVKASKFSKIDPLLTTFHHIHLSHHHLLDYCQILLTGPAPFSPLHRSGSPIGHICQVSRPCLKPPNKLTIYFIKNPNSSPWSTRLHNPAPVCLISFRFLLYSALFSHPGHISVLLHLEF